jgi:hypothetical protein
LRQAGRANPKTNKKQTTRKNASNKATPAKISKNTQKHEKQAKPFKNREKQSNTQKIKKISPPIFVWIKIIRVAD